LQKIACFFKNNEKNEKTAPQIAFEPLAQATSLKKAFFVKTWVLKLKTACGVVCSVLLHTSSEHCVFVSGRGVVFDDASHHFHMFLCHNLFTAMG
tara:strand:- start:606 stop:890 length:285 start_codon:yes stop_codon:yes gene_type:complete